MRLSNYLRPDLVVHGLEASGRQDILAAVGSQLVQKGFLTDGGEVLEALTARENAHTTVLGEGLAVPHATLPSLGEMLLLVMKAARPVPFGPQDTEAVDLFFVLLSPPNRQGEHIKLLARICRLARHPGFLDDLRATVSSEDLLETLLQVDGQHV